MSDPAGDLGYVREVVHRAEREDVPGTILFLWAGIAVVGFALVDFLPRLALAYWVVASIGGFVASSWLGRRHGRLAGQQSSADSRRQMQHWGGMLVALLLLPALVATGRLDGDTVGLVILLVIALTYWLAGVHLIPSFRWVAGVAAIVYLALALVPGFPYLWTAAGLVLATGLVVAGLSARPREAA